MRRYLAVSLPNPYICQCLRKGKDGPTCFVNANGVYYRASKCKMQFNSEEKNVLMNKLIDQCCESYVFGSTKSSRTIPEDPQKTVFLIRLECMEGELIFECDRAETFVNESKEQFDKLQEQLEAEQLKVTKLNIQLREARALVRAAEEDLRAWKRRTGQVSVIINKNAPY